MMRKTSFVQMTTWLSHEGDASKRRTSASGNPRIVLSVPISTRGTRAQSLVRTAGRRPVIFST